MKVVLVILFSSAVTFLLIDRKKEQVSPNNPINNPPQIKCPTESVLTTHGRGITDPKKRCLFILPHAKKPLATSQTVAEKKVAQLFDDVRFKDYYQGDNESNVVTNDSDFGKPRQKYDPRVGNSYQYPRFNLNSGKPKDLLSYGIIQTKERDKKEFTRLKKCQTQDFYSIPRKTKNEMKFYQELTDKILSNRRPGTTLKKLSYKFYVEEYLFENNSYLNEAFSAHIRGHSFGPLSRFGGGKSLTVANACNKSIGRISNTCRWNLSYDQLYEELFLFIEEGIISVNIYCKRSSEKSWTLIEHLNLY